MTQLDRATKSAAVSAGADSVIAGGAVATSEEQRIAAVAAGARARGMAETLDLLGVPAILLSGDAAALYVNAEAAACMGAHLGICARRLIAATAEDNARLQKAFDAALAGAGATSVTIRRAEQGDMIVHVMPAPGQNEECQLLKALVLIDATAGNGLDRALFSRLLREGARLH